MRRNIAKIAGQAEAHIRSGKVVGRECQIEALMKAMSEKGLTLVLGGKNLGKTILKNEAIRRCADRKGKINFLSVNMRDGSLAGRPLMAALDWQRQKSLRWTTRAVQGLRAVFAPVVNQACNIDNFINKAVRSGRIPSIVVDEANLALPGISGEPNTAAKAAIEVITKWTKETWQASIMLISSEYGYPYRLMECRLHLCNIRQIIVIGEVAKDDMLQMLTSDWGMDGGMANIFYDYFGGDIFTTKRALDQLVEDKEGFDPDIVVSCPALPSCVKDPEARAHLENMAEQGFSFVEDVKADKGARMIEQANVGGVIHGGDLTFGLPDIFRGTHYQWAVIPECYYLKLKVARALQNIPLPTPGLRFSLIL